MVAVQLPRSLPIGEMKMAWPLPTHWPLYSVHTPSHSASAMQARRTCLPSSHTGVPVLVQSLDVVHSDASISARTQVGGVWAVSHCWPLGHSPFDPHGTFKRG